MNLDPKALEAAMDAALADHFFQLPQRVQMEVAKSFIRTVITTYLSTVSAGELVERLRDSAAEWRENARGAAISMVGLSSAFLEQANELEQAAAALSAQAAGWRDIDECTPSGDVIVTNGRFATVAYKYRYANGYGWRPNVEHARSLNWTPTHWKPIGALPTPPQ